MKTGGRGANLVQSRFSSKDDLPSLWCKVNSHLNLNVFLTSNKIKCGLLSSYIPGGSHKLGPGHQCSNNRTKNLCLRPS